MINSDSVKNKRIEEAQIIVGEYADVFANLKINGDFSKIIDVIFLCKGKIITSGMGKAGIAMRKFSSLLCSLGFPSTYLHPGEASHGDLGVLAEEDVLFIASTSGKTREILELISLSKSLHITKIIGITSHIDSPLRKECDLILDMGVIEEAGHLSLAPTSSILVMLALTDCIALIAAKEKGFTTSDYLLRHHSGYLGEKARNNISERRD